MNTSPRTAKEALLTEMLGDLDSMLTRIENLPQLIENCEERLFAAAAALESAGEKYGQAVNGFTEQAKAEVGDFIERESVEAIERQAVAVQKIAEDILLSETKNTGSEVSDNFRQSHLSRLLEHGVLVLLGSLFTIFLFHLAFLR